MKFHLRPFAPPNPVPLHFLERIAPVNRVEIGQQFLGVGGDAEHPLAHRLADDGKSADFAFAVHDFFVGENCAKLFAPPDRLFADIGKTFGIAIGAAFGFEFRMQVGLTCRSAMDARQRVPTESSAGYFSVSIGSALFVSGLNHEL